MATGGHQDRRDHWSGPEKLGGTTDFWNIRSTRLIPILSYLREITARLPHWQTHQDPIGALKEAMEHWKG